MKNVLSGVALAALVAVAAPAWAQAPMSPSAAPTQQQTNPPAASPAASQAMPMTPPGVPATTQSAPASPPAATSSTGTPAATVATHRPKRQVRRTRAGAYASQGRYYGYDPSDTVADRLNAAQLHQAGGPPPMMQPMGAYPPPPGPGYPAPPWAYAPGPPMGFPPPPWGYRPY